MVPTERSYHKEYSYQSSSTHCSKVIKSKLKDFKDGSNSKVKISGSNISKPQKVLLTRNTHCTSTHYIKVISKVKFFKKWIKLQGQGHSVKKYETHGKVLSQGILMWNIKTLELTVQNLWARLKFSKNGSNSKVEITG